MPTYTYFCSCTYISVLPTKYFSFPRLPSSRMSGGPGSMSCASTFFFPLGVHPICSIVPLSRDKCKKWQLTAETSPLIGARLYGTAVKSGKAGHPSQSKQQAHFQHKPSCRPHVINSCSSEVRSNYQSGINLFHKKLSGESPVTRNASYFR